MHRPRAGQLGLDAGGGRGQLGLEVHGKESHAKASEAAQLVRRNRAKDNVARKAIDWQLKHLEKSSVEEVKRRLSEKLFCQAASVRQAFQEIDRDADGKITGMELRRVLERHCLRLPDEHFAELMAQYDTNMDGFIDYGEFMRAFALPKSKPSSAIPKPSPGHYAMLANTKRAAEGMSRRMRRPDLPAMGVKSRPMDMMALHTRLRKTVTSCTAVLKRAFQVHDTEKDSSVTAQEFVGVLAARGILPMGSEEALCLAAYYSTNEVNGRVNYMDFLNGFSVGVPSNRNPRRSDLVSRQSKPVVNAA